MIHPRFCVFLVLTSAFFSCFCQEYDFAAEMTRQCLVPDPVGLLDCVEKKVTLPYLTSWVDCTNSLGQNVRTSTDIINYRCKSVWEGKGLIPEVFYIKDCVIEKTGLPAKNVSAEVLGAYKECENNPSPQQQRIKTAQVQQQMRVSSVEYGPPIQQFQAPVSRPPPQQFQAAIVQPPTQQFQAPVVKAPPQPVQVQIPIQRIQVPVLSQPQNIAPGQPFQLPAARPLQPQIPASVQRPVQQQVHVLAPRPVQQAPPRTFAPIQQIPARPVQLFQQVPVALNQPAVPGPQYQTQNNGLQYTMQNPANPARQPFSYQYFIIHPQAPLPNQQQNVNKPILSQKTVQHRAFVPQQQTLASTQQVISTVPNVPFSYSIQINHPLKPAS